MLMTAPGAHVPLTTHTPARSLHRAAMQGGAGPPLELQATKSRLLHAEPAAGAVGLASLALRLGQTGRWAAVR